MLLNHCLSKGHHRINITFKVIFYVSYFLNFTLCVRFVFFLLEFQLQAYSFWFYTSTFYSTQHEHIEIYINKHQFFSFVWLGKQKLKKKLSLKSSFFSKQITHKIWHLSSFCFSFFLKKKWATILRQLCVLYTQTHTPFTWSQRSQHDTAQWCFIH